MTTPNADKAGFAADAQESNRLAKHSAKETVISIIIAFSLAFVFRGFVVEAYVIPTGSMAPTLMGQHVRFTGDTGYQWPMGPIDYANNNFQTPLATQGTRENPIVSRDPMTGPARESRFERTKGTTSLSNRGIFDKTIVNAPIRGGDRIFVMKYLYSIYDPTRFDVVVFKNPRQPTENYIKRLVGLPGEQICIVDGDLFTRPAPEGSEVGPQTPADQPSPWTQEGWTIARKQGREAESMWQVVHDSVYIPVDPVRDGRRWAAPWLPNGIRTVAKDWTLLGVGSQRGLYTYTGANATSLVWDAANWPITDSYPYNDQSRGRLARPRPNGEYPVSDLSIRFAINPSKIGSRVSAVITSCGHEFKGMIAKPAPGSLGNIGFATSGAAVNGSAMILMRALPAGADIATDPESGWKVLEEKPLPKGALASGAYTRFEFRHLDQSLEVRINDVPIATASYDWSPAERLRNATNMTVEQVIESGDLGILSDSSRYTNVGVRIELDAGAATLANVAILRDVFYRPDLHPSGSRIGLPGAGTHPRYTLTLRDDQFFVCGDNSPDSLDGRLWGDPDEWTKSIDPYPSVVNRRLLIGKAFFVYFPAVHRWQGIPVPDFGRMRWIF